MAPLHPPRAATGERLVPRDALPPQLRPLFHHEYFNAMQSAVFELAFGSDAPLVVAAPTGSGKTAVLELALARLWSTQSDDIRPAAVYIAPLKALTTERLNDWAPRFSAALGIKCCELTGDSVEDEEQAVQAAQLIITTPEKWDAFTRFRRSEGVVGRIGLLLVDEIHLLHDKGRGPTLESIIGRMKLVAQSPMVSGLPISRLRMLAISATIDNVGDIAQWIRPDCVARTFDESYRPVPLQWHVVSYRMGKTFAFDALLASHLLQVVRKYNNGRPALVFCNSRKAAQSAAVAVSSAPGGAFVRRDSAQVLGEASRGIVDVTLRGMVARGVAFYSAALDVADKRAVEQLFLHGHLGVVCSTTGLAQGVNLPAHLVVICNTCHYQNGGYEEYSRIEVLQMAGRAGRPQFDTSGVCVVMTRDEMKAHYSRLLSGTETIESHMVEHMAAHLNAEIAFQRQMSDVAACIDWLKASFAYVRIKRNPNFYGQLAAGATEAELEGHLRTLCMRHIRCLEQHGLLAFDADGVAVRPLPLGTIMARHYLELDTVPPP